MKNQKQLSKPRHAPKKKAASKAPPISKDPAPLKAPAINPSPQVNPRIRLELFAPEAREVFVAGSFNDWRPRETALHSAGSGKWAGELALPPGHYEYLFQVDGQWLLDPQAKEFAPNPFGGMNCLLQVPSRL